jgi:hypothetical protein
MRPDGAVAQDVLDFSAAASQTAPDYEAAMTVKRFVFSA